MEQNYMLSVIMPCYNVAQYIEKAVNSVLSQDFKDYEVILINDGSPDNLLQVCEQWKDKPNFTLVTTVNQGASEARNEGLKRAKGKYVYFMDPDDYISPGMFREVMAKCEQGDYDAVHFGFKMITEKPGGIESCDSAEKETVYLSNKAILTDYLPRYIGFGQEHINHWKEGNIWSKKEFAGVWRFFFKRSVLVENHVRFRKEVSLFEDMLFISLFFLYANSIATMDRVYYNYVIKDGGLLLGTRNNFDKLVVAKMKGVTERALLRQLYLDKRGVDIFQLYNGTLVLGALEVIVRGARIPIGKCYQAVKTYLRMDDVKKAYKTTDLSGFTAKMKIPALMVKYGMTLPLVMLIKIADLCGIKLKEQ